VLVGLVVGLRRNTVAEPVADTSRCMEELPGAEFATPADVGSASFRVLWGYSPYPLD